MSIIAQQRAGHAVMAKPEQVLVTDGRRLRSERSRQATIDAAVALTEEGVLVPTAQQIADRAGVGIRTFFRHFSDMETFFQAVDDHIRDSYESLFMGGDRRGTLDERIRGAVARHAAAYETVKNTILSTQAQLWRYQTLRRNYARSQRGLRRDLEDWLPELRSVPGARREAVDAVASFEMWHRLRAQQGLSIAASTAIVAELLTSLVGEH